MVIRDQTRYAILAVLDRLVPNRLMKFAFLDQVVASGGNFVCAILLARALGMYEFGRFALAWMLVEFMASLQFAAIIQPMLNIGPKQAEADSDRYYSAVIAQQGAACALLGPIVGIGVTLTGSLMSDPTLVGVALPICAAIMTYQLYEFFRRYLFARGRPVAGLCIDVLRFAIQLAAILAMPHAWPGATAEVGIWIVAAACAVAVPQGAWLFGRVEWNATAFCSVLNRHWQFSKWLMPSVLMFWTTTEAYLIVSGLVLGAAATGALKAAGTITGIMNILFLALNNFGPVQASRALHVGGPIALRRYIARLAGLSAGLMAVAIAILNIAPEYVIHLFYGEQYKDLGQLVRLLCAPAAVYGISAVLVIWAAALEQTRLIFWSYAVATPFSIIAAFPLVQYGGLAGLVLCSLLVESIRFGVLLVPLVRWSRRREYATAQLAPMPGGAA
jgi:O-antigen/teichoic acid export membrane protein